jgi:pyruvate carboxylase subunit B
MSPDGYLGGVDMIDTVLSPLLWLIASGHQTMVASLKGTFDTGIDEDLEGRPKSRGRSEKYEKYETGYTGVSADVFIHKVPCGMISNMVAQLKEAKRMDLMEAALKETPSVEKDLGHPPLLTPTSQIVGVQAVLNVLAGER